MSTSSTMDIKKVIISGTVVIGIIYVYYKYRSNKSLLSKKLQNSSDPIIKPIYYTNNPLKAQEVNLLLGFPIEVRPIHDQKISAFDLVTKTSAELFRTVIREEIEMTIGNESEQYPLKQIPIGYNITEEELKLFIGYPMSVRTRVYVAEPEQEVRVFQSTMNGQIVEAKTDINNPLCFGWDRMFRPNGFALTVAELGKQRNMLNFRSQVYGHVSDYLLGLPRSIFEAHITVTHQQNGHEISEEEQREKFIKFCSDMGLKAILIELQSGKPDNGIFQFQTSKYYKKSFREVRDDIDRISREFVRQGWVVQRQKIEATPCLRPGSINCPIEDEDVTKYSQSNYFEFHAKILMTPDNENIVRGLCKSHDAHLSRNAFKKLEFGDHRFLTLRIYGVGQKTSFQRFDRLLDDLERANVKIIQSQREYAVWDTNVRLDAGWIN